MPYMRLQVNKVHRLANVLVSARLGNGLGTCTPALVRSERFTNTGDSAKLYGRAFSRLNLRRAAITLGVVIAIRRMTGSEN
jgi:hypothetical protein